MASPESTHGEDEPAGHVQRRLQGAQEERAFARQERDNARVDRETAKKERDSAKQERDAVKHAFLQCADPDLKKLLQKEWASAQLEVEQSQIALNDAQTALRNAQKTLDAQAEFCTRLAVQTLGGCVSSGSSENNTYIHTTCVCKTWSWKPRFFCV